MIEKIFHKKKLFALIVRSKFRKKNGINFFTKNNSTQQFGYMKHKKNYVIKPHFHLKRVNKIFYTSETIILLKGKLRIDFYDNKKKYLLSKVLQPSEIIVLISGGHGFKTLNKVDPPGLGFAFFEKALGFAPLPPKVLSIRSAVL